MPKRFNRAAVGAALLAALVVVACGNDSESTSGDIPTGDGTDDGVAEFTVVATEPTDGEYHYEVPDQVAAGATRLSLVNEGDELHHAQLFELNDGATVDEVAAALATGNPAAPLAYGSFVGGTSLVAPNSTSQADAVADLTPGTYVLICFVEGPDGAPHLAHGMLQPFEVTASNETIPLPQPDLRAEMFDYGYELPGEVEGDAVVEVTNAAALEPHELTVARLDDGASAEDVAAALAAGDEPLATTVGGMQAVLAGDSQFLQLDVAPGDYVVFCEIPSVVDQQPHVDKGMIKEVTVK